MPQKNTTNSPRCGVSWKVMKFILNWVLCKQRKATLAILMRKTLKTFWPFQTDMENLCSYASFSCRHSFVLKKKVMTRHLIPSTCRFVEILATSIKGDIAVWDQLCASVITWCLTPYTKCCRRDIRKIASKFQQGELTIKIFRWFASIALKNEKGCVTYSPRFNPCPSMPSVATDGRKQFYCPHLVLNNKTGPLLLEFNWCEDTF